MKPISGKLYLWNDKKECYIPDIVKYVNETDFVCLTNVNNLVIDFNRTYTLSDDCYIKECTKLHELFFL